jgi:hypothetical protein
MCTARLAMVIHSLCQHGAFVFWGLLLTSLFSNRTVVGSVKER